MKITPMNYNCTNQNLQKKNNQTSFGMKIVEMDELAIYYAARNFLPVDKFEKLMPEIADIKAKTGKEILLKFFGDSTARGFRIEATEEGTTNALKDIIFSPVKGKSTYEPSFNFLIDDLIPTLEKIKSDLDFMSNPEIEAKLSQAENFYRNLYGKKS